MTDYAVASFQQQYWTREQTRFLQRVAALSGLSLYAVPKDFGSAIGVAYWDPKDSGTARQRQGFVISEDLMTAQVGGVTLAPETVAEQIRWLWENAPRIEPGAILWDREYHLFGKLDDLIESVLGDARSQ